MVTRCSLFLIDSKNYYILSTRKASLVKLGLSIVRKSLILLLCIYTNGKVSKYVKCGLATSPVCLGVDTPHLNEV